MNSGLPNKATHAYVFPGTGAYFFCAGGWSIIKGAMGGLVDAAALDMTETEGGLIMTDAWVAEEDEDCFFSSAGLMCWREHEEEGGGTFAAAFAAAFAEAFVVAAPLVAGRKVAAAPPAAGMNVTGAFAAVPLAVALVLAVAEATAIAAAPAFGWDAVDCGGALPRVPLAMVSEPTGLRILTTN